MEEKLKEIFGLTDKEAIVYVKLLETGQATTKRLSEITGIARTTLYDVLKSLMAKGMAGEIEIDKVKYFYAVSPEVLLKKLREKQKAFSEILPELKKREKIIGKKPQLRVFEGRKGIDIIHEDVLKAKQIIAFGSFKILSKIAKWQTINFLKRRLSRRIKWKGVTDSSIKKAYFYNDPKYRKLTRLRIDDSLAEMPTWNYIYSNKVAILSVKKENFIGIIIEDEAINKSYKIIFEKIWKNAKKAF